MSDYQSALVQAAETVWKRTRSFRNLIVAVAVTGLVSIGSAIALMSLKPMSCLLLLAPLTHMFLWHDSVLLRRWHQQLAEAWVQRQVDYAALSQALTAHPTLPQATVLGMIETFPMAADLRFEQAVSTRTREATTAAVALRDDGDADALAGWTLAFAGGSTAAIGASLAGLWYPLLALGFLPIVPIVIRRRRRRRRLDAVIERIRQLQADRGFVGAQFRDLVAALTWEPRHRSDRKRLLDL